jgi:hypothetical protein
MVRSVRARLLSRTTLAFVGAVAMLVTLFAPPPQASAATVWLQVWWIRCDDQSEPFSDEIRLRFNGQIIGAWNDVDDGETHWYYSSQLAIPLNRAFSGNTAVDIMEADGEYHLIGWVNVSEGEVGTGQHVVSANMWDGRYTVNYEITANPV